MAVVMVTVLHSSSLQEVLFLEENFFKYPSPILVCLINYNVIVQIKLIRISSHIVSPKIYYLYCSFDASVEESQYWSKPNFIVKRVEPSKVYTTYLPCVMLHWIVNQNKIYTYPGIY